MRTTAKNLHLNEIMAMIGVKALFSVGIKQPADENYSAFFGLTFFKTIPKKQKKKNM